MESVSFVGEFVRPQRRSGCGGVHVVVLRGRVGVGRRVDVWFGVVVPFSVFVVVVNVVESFPGRLDGLVVDFGDIVRFFGWGDVVFSVGGLIRGGFWVGWDDSLVGGVIDFIWLWLWLWLLLMMMLLRCRCSSRSPSWELWEGKATRDVPIPWRFSNIADATKATKSSESFPSLPSPLLLLPRHAARSKKWKTMRKPRWLRLSRPRRDPRGGGVEYFARTKRCESKEEEEERIRSRRRGMPTGRIRRTRAAAVGGTTSWSWRSISCII
mmetsp:Transcript_13798/g.29058  ORF Transcript_13798/g.29058 Transcript_13798/m.29058 type:complete len:268 (+) Transcript_13798:696-1499(+)